MADEKKNFMLMEDNADGTMTVTLNIPDFGESMVVLVAMPFQEYISSMMMGIDRNMSVRELMEEIDLEGHSTKIPDDTEDM